MICAQSGKGILVGPYMNMVGVTVSHTYLWLLNSILHLRAVLLIPPSVSL